MVVFLNPNRAPLMEALYRARDLELARGEGMREDLLEFVSAVLVEEASGSRLGASSANVRSQIGALLDYFADKYRNPRILRIVAAFVMSSYTR